MKVISVWQPYASLLVTGFKFTETRGFPAPKSIIKTTIAIASTKIIRPEQRAAMEDPLFRKYYDMTGLPELDALPHGCVLGTVFVNSSDPIDEEDLEEITEEERIFGWWQIGRFAWRCRYPKLFDAPIPARGAQGIWDWTPPHGTQGQYQGHSGQEGAPPLRRHLHVV